MSEYQYYEFQAIDRPLTERETATLRGCSSRATITPTRFVNNYSYGSFIVPSVIAPSCTMRRSRTSMYPRTCLAQNDWRLTSCPRSQT
jgi:hypothetical protein